MKKYLRYGIIIIAIFIMCIIPTFASGLKGDINNDGKVNQIDVNFVKYYILQSITLTPDQLTAADMNGDGKVTITDLLQIEKIILNK